MRRACALAKLSFRCLTFHNTNHDNNDIRPWVVLHGICNAVVYLVCSLNFLHAVYGCFEREKFAQLVRDVKWAIIDNVPIKSNIIQVCYTVFKILKLSYKNSNSLKPLFHSHLVIYQTEVASKRSSCDLKGKISGSPIRILPRIVPAKQSNMLENQDASGCLRENI